MCHIYNEQTRPSAPTNRPQCIGGDDSVTPLGLSSIIYILPLKTNVIISVVVVLL